MCYEEDRGGQWEPYSYFFMTYAEQNYLMTNFWPRGLEDDHGLSWNSTMRMRPSLGGNVHLLNFFADEQHELSNGDEVHVKVYDNGSFYLSGGYDYRHANGTNLLDHPFFGEMSNWHFCWDWSASGMLWTINWVSSFPPMNPSCEPVQLFQEYRKVQEPDGRW